jgi:hypothetical protein
MVAGCIPVVPAGARAPAIDADGYVYAESYGKHSDIAVLARDGSRVIRTITDGVVYPNRIAVGY